jgi:hypothetical protein
MGEVHVIPFGQPAIGRGARKPRGREKVARRPAAPVIVHGVRLSSEDGKSLEYAVMALIIEALPPELRCLIESVSCDSTAGFDVHLRIPDMPSRVVRRIGAAFEQACFVSLGGHNGIFVNPGHLVIEPEWDGFPAA